MCMERYKEFDEEIYHRLVMRWWKSNAKTSSVWWGSISSQLERVQVPKLLLSQHHHNYHIQGFDNYPSLQGRSEDGQR